MQGDISAGLQGKNARANNVVESDKNYSVKNIPKSVLLEKMEDSNNKRKKKGTDRATYVATDEFNFEVHFKFQSYEPLILLTEVLLTHF